MRHQVHQATLGAETNNKKEAAQAPMPMPPQQPSSAELDAQMRIQYLEKMHESQYKLMSQLISAISNKENVPLSSSSAAAATDTHRARSHDNKCKQMAAADRHARSNSQKTAMQRQRQHRDLVSSSRSASSDRGRARTRSKSTGATNSKSSTAAATKKKKKKQPTETNSKNRPPTSASNVTDYRNTNEMQFLENLLNNTTATGNASHVISQAASNPVADAAAEHMFSKQKGSYASAVFDLVDGADTPTLFDKYLVSFSTIQFSIHNFCEKRNQKRVYNII